MKSEQKSAPKLIKARVRPFNNYSGSPAGSIVEVEPAEIARIPHCLVSLEDEKRELAESQTQVSASTEKTRQELDGYRQMFRSQYEQFKKNEAAKLAREAQRKAEESKKLSEE